MRNLTNLMHKIRQDLFYKNFNKVIKETSGLIENDKIIIAVSGGLDSIALLFMLEAINVFEICVAHINHKIRANSDKDEQYVKLLSKKMGLKFVSKSLNPKTINKGASIEEWARKKRYDFLMRSLKKTKSKKILTAHHANDQIETILMNLSRGSGVLGLRGIDSVIQASADGTNTFQDISTNRIQSNRQAIGALFSEMGPGVLLDLCGQRLNESDGGSAIILPKGLNIDRPWENGYNGGNGPDAEYRKSNAEGALRYNSENRQFEGYSSEAWQGLGGVTDIEQQSRVTASHDSTNSGQDRRLRFFVHQ